MAFARQIPLPRRVADLSRFVDTPRQRRDPCFRCTLPFGCDETSPQCLFVNTASGSRTIERERQELVAELKANGVILPEKRGIYFQYAADTETPDERRRRSKREHMRRIRAKETKCTTG